jgi:hypothetical protein
MRSSFLSSACAAAALAMLLPCACGANEPAACCVLVEESKSAPADGAAAEAEAAPPSTEESHARAKAAADAKAAPTPLDLSTEEVADRVSYADVFKILKDENSCSDFFGGPRLSLTVFNRLALQLRSRRLGSGMLAVLMSGSYTVFKDTDTGASYRLFEEAVINSEGPFALRGPSTWSSRLQIGRFPAETRQAKALILLHELGHLVGTRGGWVLPDDGGDARQSERNTEAVESRCVKQLLALKV